VLGILIAGWASANKYSLLGGLRGAGQLIAYELPLVLATVGVVIQAGTMNLQNIVVAQNSGEIFGMDWIGNPYIFTQFLGFLIFMIAVQAELSQTPFDMPIAESELVSGYMTEYSGFRFLIFFIAEFATAGVFALIASVLFLGIRVVPMQILGMIVTIGGVVLISVKGDMEILRTLALNIGDVFTLIACVFYAAYTLGLRRKPPVSGLVFFTALAVVAFVTSVPLLVMEIAQGNVQWPTPKGWLIMLYIGLLPSLLAQVFFIRGVELMGPARAGVFVNLVPVFGALLAVLLLGEPFAAYHAIGLAFVLGGIWLAERRA